MGLGKYKHVIHHFLIHSDAEATAIVREVGPKPPSIMSCSLFFPILNPTQIPSVESRCVLPQGQIANWAPLSKKAIKVCVPPSPKFCVLYEWEYPSVFFGNSKIFDLHLIIFILTAVKILKAVDEDGRVRGHGKGMTPTNKPLHFFWFLVV